MFNITKNIDITSKSENAKPT